MPKPLTATCLALLGACAFLLWHLSTGIAELKDQVQDLEAAVTALQLSQAAPAAADSPPTRPDLSSKRAKAGKASKAGKAGKNGKAGAGAKDRGAQMAEVVATFAQEQALDEDTTAALNHALTTLSTSVKASRASGGGGDPSSMREQRQAHFGDFEASVQEILAPELAQELLDQIKASRGGGGPPR